MSRIDRKLRSIIRLTSAWLAAPREQRSIPEDLANGSNAPVAVFSSTIVRPSANIAGMRNDPKHIVVSGYDEVANVYLERFGVSTVRQKWMGRLVDGLPAAGGGRVLDLGCGAGIPVARDLAALGTLSSALMGRHNRWRGLGETSPRRRLSKRICAK
jgi:hypothetical protein